VETLVILMAPFFGASGPMQPCLQHLCRSGLHRSSGLQKAQAIRMTSGAVLPSRPWSAVRLRPRPLKASSRELRNWS